MNLIVGLYTEPHEWRRAEIRQCLVANLANPFFGRVLVIEEDEGALASYLGTFEHIEPSSTIKLRRIGLHQRITFDDVFFLARTALDPSPWVLANNDIEFDASIAHAGNVPPGELWCVTRTELDGTMSPNAAWTQDAWIWNAQTTVLGDLAFDAALDWHLGVMGCENRLAHAAAASGLALRNPGRYIRALHRHSSNVRRRLPNYNGKGLPVPLEEPPTLRDCTRSGSTK